MTSQGAANSGRPRVPHPLPVEEYCNILQPHGLPRNTTFAQISQLDEQTLERFLLALNCFRASLDTHRSNQSQTFRTEVQQMIHRVGRRVVEIEAHHILSTFGIPRDPNFDRDFLGRFNEHQVYVLFSAWNHVCLQARKIPRDMLAPAFVRCVDLVEEYVSDMFSGLGVALEHGGPAW